MFLRRGKSNLTGRIIIILGEKNFIKQAGPRVSILAEMKFQSGS